MQRRKARSRRHGAAAHATMRSKRAREQKEQQEWAVSNKMFDTLVKLFAVFGIEFSSRYNARFGLPHVVAMMLEMCDGNFSAETAKQRLGGKMPTSQWFLNRVRSVGVKQMLKNCDRVLEQSAEQALKQYKKGDHITIAIDKHLIARYDKNTDSSPYIIKSIIKNTVGKCEAYATMQIVGGATIACVPLVKNYKVVDFMRKFLRICNKHGIHAKLFLLDREFFSVDVMTTLDDAGVKFIMPAKKTPNVKSALNEYDKGKRNKVSRLLVMSRALDNFCYTIVIKKVIPKPKPNKKENPYDKFHCFATNMSRDKAMREVENIPEEYRKRWAIETGYRQAEQVRARTCSRDPTVRMFQFYASLIIVNIWTHIKYKKGLEYMILSLLLCRLKEISLDSLKLNRRPRHATTSGLLLEPPEPG